MTPISAVSNPLLAEFSKLPAGEINPLHLDQKETELRNAANKLEAAFISEMLSHAGLDEAVSGQSGFGGEAFSRFLVERYADELVEKGGFGLAEKIYAQLKEDQS